MKRLLPILPVMLLVLSGCETSNDKDWNLYFYDNCGMPKGDSMQWIEQGKNKFIRFQLRDKDYGGCSSDRMRRHGAPYWERAELKQSSTLASNTKYELAFKIRFVEGFSGNRESFWQMHAYNSPCRAKPPIMIKISEGDLILAAQKEGGGHKVYSSGIKIGDLIGKWNNVKLNFDTTSYPEISLYLNDKEVFLNIPFWVEACGTPHFKFGIYRPGNKSKNKHSIVDFDKIILTQIKKDFIRSVASVSCLKMVTPILKSKIYSAKTCNEHDKQLTKYQRNYISRWSKNDISDEKFQWHIKWALENIDAK